jgi:alcohol dehydrogenase (NADP+)
LPTDIEETSMYNETALAATDATAPLSTITIPRRDPLDHDVQIEILYCGICHSDLHHIRDEFKALMPTHYPFVPGHEIVGRVTAVGRRSANTSPGTWSASAAWSSLTSPVRAAKPAVNISAPT